MDLVTLSLAKKYTDKAIAQAAVGDIDVESYVKEAVDDVIGSASETFNSLGEIETAVNNKVDKVSGKGLSTNDFTNAYKNKVDSALQSYTETDPTVPEWAKTASKPKYTASEVGALPDTTTIPTTLASLAEDATHRVVTDKEKTSWNAKSNFSGNYNDLTNKPTIPSIAGLATTSYVDNAMANIILTSEGGKKFKLTVDDTGALTANEVTE
jgi:hypothetical protein